MLLLRTEMLLWCTANVLFLSILVEDVLQKLVFFKKKVHITTFSENLFMKDFNFIKSTTWNFTKNRVKKMIGDQAQKSLLHLLDFCNLSLNIEEEQCSSESIKIFQRTRNVQCQSEYDGLLSFTSPCQHQFLHSIRYTNVLSLALVSPRHLKSQRF